jgi:alkylation response protein AidB-like acyl-CoA dehydrogenase
MIICQKWFISGGRGIRFAILISWTKDGPDIPQAANSAFLVDLPSADMALRRVGRVLLTGR